jgi:hypothetical protein
MTKDGDRGSGVAAPAGWQDWRPSRTWAQSLDAFDPGGIQIRLGTP